MTPERIKEIQQETAYPYSISVQQALLKVWNECEQERVKNCNTPDVRRSFSYKEVQKIVLDIMNLGMSLRQDQLNGWTDKSGNEVLKEYVDRL